MPQLRVHWSEDRIQDFKLPNQVLLLAPLDSHHENFNDWPSTVLTSPEAAKRYLDLQLGTIKIGEKRKNEDFFYSQLRTYARKRHKACDHQGFEENELCDLMSALTVRKTDSDIFDLPAELRNQIYRNAFDEIPMTTTSTFPEPPLLLVSKQIRREAGHLLYTEHTFKVVPTLNTEPLLAFGRKNGFVVNEFGTNMKREIVQVLPLPDWRDLMLSLRRHHNGHKAWVNSTDTIANSLSPTAVWQRTIRTMLALVNELSDLPWDRVAPVLEQHHDLLISIDAQWA